MLLLAEIYMEQDDREQVEALCRRVLEREPDNGRADFDLGMIALTHNDVENCIPHLLRAADSPFARQRLHSSPPSTSGRAMWRRRRNMPNRRGTRLQMFPRTTLIWTKRRQ